MSKRKNLVRFAAALAAAGVLAATACGNKPVEQAAATPAPPPAESTAQPTPQPPPAEAPAPAPTPAPEPKAQPKPAAKPTPQPPAPQPEPAPAPAPAPEPIVKTVGAGTSIAVVLETPASSKTNQVGDVLTARVAQAVSVDGIEVIPAGATVLGKVTEAVPVQKIGGAASLGVKFDTVQLPGGGTVAIDASVQQKAKSQTGKDAGTIAGAAAGGALLGRLLSKHDKTKGTIIGAAVGAAAGTGISVATKGQEVEFAVGTPFDLKLEAPTTVTVQR